MLHSAGSRDTENEEERGEKKKGSCAIHCFCLSVLSLAVPLLASYLGRGGAGMDAAPATARATTASAEKEGMMRHSRRQLPVVLSFSPSLPAALISRCVQAYAPSVPID